MRRGLFTLCSALSLLLCVAVCVLWVRSYWLTDAIGWRNAGGWRSVHSAQGSIVVQMLLADWAGYPVAFHGPRYERHEAGLPFNWLMLLGGERGDKDSSWERGGFAWHEKRNAPRSTMHAIAVAPFWSIALATAALPLGWTTMRWRSRVRRRWRESRSLCPSCGYDLRATPQGGRCPECGTRSKPLPRSNDVPTPIY